MEYHNATALLCIVKQRLFSHAAPAIFNGIGIIPTTNIHAFWLNALHNAAGEPRGLELGTTGITSPGDFAEFGEALGAEIDARLAAHNREVLWTDNGPRGWLGLTLTPTEGRAQCLALSTVTETRYTQRVLKEVVITREGGLLKLG